MGYYIKPAEKNQHAMRDFGFNIETFLNLDIDKAGVWCYDLGMSVTYEDIVKERAELISKIKPFIKNGHVPHRGKVPYTICFEQVNRNTNCFEHACFNFTDVELLQLDVNFAESFVFGGHYAWACADTKADMLEYLQSFLCSTGLKFEECHRDATLKNNQWKVALFLSPDWEKFKDYHFLLQEKDGTWSAKDGFTKKTSFFDTLYERVKSNGDVYDFYKTFAITNPYAEKGL